MVATKLSDQPGTDGAEFRLLEPQHSPARPCILIEVQRLCDVASKLSSPPWAVKAGWMSTVRLSQRRTSQRPSLALQLPSRRWRAPRQRLRVPGSAAQGPSPMGLLALQRRCCRLSPGGPARTSRGSRRWRLNHLSLCRSRPRSLLRTLRNLKPSRHRTRAAKAELPQSRGLQRRARWRWRPLGCRFVRGQPQRKRRPNRTPSPSA